MAGGLLGADFDDPKTQGLLGMALSMLANSGPSPVRQTFGSIVGRAGMEGMAAGNRARVLQQRDEELRRRNALVDAQLRKMQASEAEEAAARQAVVEEARRLSTPQYPPGTSVVQLDPAKQPQNVTPTLPKFDPLEAISRGVPLSAVATMRGLQPKPGEGFTLGRGEARYDESGRLIATAPKSDERSQEEKLGALIYGEGTPQYMDYLRRLAEKKASHAPGTNVNLSVNTEKTLLSNVSGEIGKDIASTRAAAVDAAEAIEHANRVRKALDTNKAITGPMAEARLSVAQLANTLGLTGPEAVTQTRIVIQGMAKMALGARSQLKGQGQVSDYEGKLLQRAEAGDISMTASEIRTIANVADRQARKLIELNRRNAKSFADNPNAAILMPYFDVTEPEQYTQQPSSDEVDSALRKYLPEKR